jgi:hypothetical protein
MSGSGGVSLPRLRARSGRPTDSRSARRVAAASARPARPRRAEGLPAPADRAQSGDSALDHVAGLRPGDLDRPEHGATFGDTGARSAARLTADDLVQQQHGPPADSMAASLASRRLQAGSHGLQISANSWPSSTTCSTPMPTRSAPSAPAQANSSSQHLGHARGIRRVGLPGSGEAARQPWRLATAPSWEEARHP